MDVRDDSLVGREQELSKLERALEQAREGSSRFVAISGEPGIGKTRLLAELGRRAHSDCLVLEGAAAEFESELPFGLVVDAFDAYLQSLDPRSFDRLAADGLGALATVFPALRSLEAGSGSPPAAGERFRAHYAVRELIERLAARQPLMIALDDLHWADGASLELVAHLLRRRPQAPVLVAVAYRSGQVEPAMAAAIERAAMEGDVARLDLGPLSSEDAERLVGGDGRGRRDGLYRASGGNPFYLLQLTRSDSSGGRASADGSDSARGDVDVPPAVAASIAAELDTLSPPGHGLAQAAAVAGDPFELDLAAAIAAAQESDTLAALNELVARQLVHPAEVPREYRFRHPLVRHAVYESCPPGTRLEAHRRAAEALQERGASASTLAHHVEQSARHGDEAAVAVLRDAGRATAQGAPATAARWLGAALRLLPDGADPGERIGLLAGFAAASAATGRFEDARAALIEAIELAPAEPVDARVELIVQCANTEQLLGRHDEAHARLEAALEALPSRGSREGVALQIAAAVGAYYRAEYARVSDWGTPALEAAHRLDEPALAASAAGVLAFGDAFAGAIEDAMREHDEAQRLVDAMSDEELAVRLDAIVHLAASEYILDRFESGIGHAQRALAIARRTGQGELLPLLVPALASLLCSRGRLEDAAGEIEQAIDGARLTGNAAALAWSLCLQSVIASWRGDLATARSAATAALPLAEERGERLIAAYAGACLADALYDSGEPERSIEAMTSAAGGPDLPLVPIGWRAHALEIMALALCDLDRVAGAERAATTARQVADHLGLPLSNALAGRAEAAVALAKEDWKTAAEVGLSAAVTCDEIGAPAEAGLARTMAGQGLAGMGDTDRATTEFERAVADLDECGARRYRDAAVRELRKLGKPMYKRRPRGRADAGGVESLTERELEVARLVVDRRTNPEIAAELFLSLKTVESHMRNIFRKLDVSSRVEVARAVESDER